VLQRLVAAAAGDQVIDLAGFKCPEMMIAAAADGQVIDRKVVALLLKDSAWRQAAGSPRALLKAAAFYTRTTIEGVLPTIPFPLRGECLTEWVPEWAAHFIEVPQELLLEIVCLACSTGLVQLANLACARVASLMRQAPKYIQRTFNIASEFTQEEEARVREDSGWHEVSKGHDSGYCDTYLSHGIHDFSTYGTGGGSGSSGSKSGGGSSVT
jgi:hypothetical protein